VQRADDIRPQAARIIFSFQSDRLIMEEEESKQE